MHGLLSIIFWNLRIKLVVLIVLGPLEFVLLLVAAIRTLITKDRVTFKKRAISVSPYCILRQRLQCAFSIVQSTWWLTLFEKGNDNKLGDRTFERRVLKKLTRPLYSGIMKNGQLWYLVTKTKLNYILMQFSIPQNWLV